MVGSLRLRACWIGFFALAVTACAGDDTGKRTELTRREKDSIIGASSIPGARGVKKAISSADSAAARQARLDSAEREP